MATDIRGTYKATLRETGLTTRHRYAVLATVGILALAACEPDRTFVAEPGKGTTGHRRLAYRREARRDPFCSPGVVGLRDVAVAGAVD